MPEGYEFKEGMFCWWELNTTDGPAAQKFYTQLFGWKAVETPLDNGGVYVMLQLTEGVNIGALYEMGDEREKRIPPHWLHYLLVKDVDARTEKAKSLGAAILTPPVDVMEIGRMSLIQDPTGGIVSLWQEKEHSIPTAYNEPGAACWNELMTRDWEKASEFFVSLCGWETEIMESGEGPYVSCKIDGEWAGGIGQIGESRDDSVLPYWLLYFMVGDCGKTAESCISLGGTVLAEPRDIPGIGRIATLRDPQGAVFAVISGPA